MGRRDSPGFAHDRLSRRQWLRLCAATGVSLSGPRLGRASEKTTSLPGFGKAKSVLLVYANGGQSQIDTWEPKPEAPDSVRGAFRPIRTRVPGTLICEHMPRLARLAHLYTIVRSFSHDDLDHGSATYLALTGHFHAQKSANPPPRPEDFPTYGAILHRVRPSRTWSHSSIYLNGPALVPELPGPGQSAGLLGRAYDPLWVYDPLEPNPLPGLEPQDDLPAARLQARRQLLAQVDDARRELNQATPTAEMQESYRQAYLLLDRPQVRSAFDLSQEPMALRERYGRYRVGQACLLARRLVEAGVPWITVNWCLSNRGQDRSPGVTEAYGWDTHNDIFEALQHHLLPRFDATFATLLEDLEQRGLLDTTLVVCVGEFGRAPLVALEKNFAGSTPGRKHWAAAYSGVLAGAGVKRGALVGGTDRRGAYVTGNQYGPWDLAATLFAALGIAPDGHYVDAAARPYPITTGKVMAELYS